MEPNDDLRTALRLVIEALKHHLTGPDIWGTEDWEKLTEAEALVAPPSPGEQE